MPHCGRDGGGSAEVNVHELDPVVGRAKQRHTHTHRHAGPHAFMYACGLPHAPPALACTVTKGHPSS
eukprot:1153246-Pelagomonas_calceolata.AAC.1